LLILTASKTDEEREFYLLSSIKEFILEIGKEFCFMGQEDKVQVGNSDFFIDLLLHRKEKIICIVLHIRL